MKTMEDVGVEIQFEEGNTRIDGELIDGGWKLARKRLKEKLKKGVKNQKTEKYGMREQQSELCRRHEECHVEGRNVTVVVPESQPWENSSDYDNVGVNGRDKTWKEATGLTGNGSCRICIQHPETVEHLVAGCIKLANSEYLTRNNRALILAVTWAKEQELVGQKAI